VKALIESGADIKVKNKGGQTLLHMACQGGFESVVQLLIESGADLSINDRNASGLTPLHEVCDQGYMVSIVELLIESGADVNIQDDAGNTPLHMACKVDDHQTSEWRDSYRALILAGADTQLQNEDGRLPIDVLRNANAEGRLLFEEAVIEAEAQALKPVLK
jgi:hypothetical protein